MKHASLRRLIASLLLASAFSNPAASEPAPATPAGEWSFATGTMGNGCVLSGQMSVMRRADKTFTCRFVADWSCKRGMMKSVRTAQTCQARQTGPDVVVTSRMEKVTRADPAELLDYMRANYAADHFAVKINARGDEMRGLFHSYGEAEVIFRKHHDLIS